MKALYLCIGLILTASNATAEMRTWTAAKNGQTFVGELISESGSMVILKSRDGKTIKVPIAGLSKADQDYVAFNRPIKLEINMGLTTPEKPTDYGCCPRIRLKKLDNKVIEKKLDLYALVFDKSGKFLAGTCEKDIRFDSDRGSEPIILDDASFPEKQYEDMLVMLIDSGDNIVAYKGTSRLFDAPPLRSQLLNQIMCYCLLQNTSAEPSDSPPEEGLVGLVYDLHLNRDGSIRALGTDRYEQAIESIRAAHNRLRMYYRSPNTITSSAFIWPTMFIPSALNFLGCEKDGSVNDRTRSYIDGRLFSFRGAITPAENITFRFVSRNTGQIFIGLRGKDLHPLPSNRSDSKPQPSVFPSGSTTTVHGDWITLEKGQAVGIEVIVAPTKNAVVDALLFVEVKGETYDRDAAGAPILPLFATSELSEDLLRRFYNGIQFGTKPLDPVIFKVEQAQAKNK